MPDPQTRLRALADAVDRERDNDERRCCMACGGGHGKAQDEFDRAIDATELSRWAADAADSMLELAAMGANEDIELLARLDSLVGAAAPPPPQEPDAV